MAQLKNFNQFSKMGKIYDANQIIGKTLYAFIDLPIYRQANDTAKSVFTVKQGSPIGVVYSYLSPGFNRSNLWWVYRDSNGNEYYTEHQKGIYDFKALESQGAKDTEAIIKEQTEANLTPREFYSNKVVKIVGLVLIAYLLKEPIKNLLKR